MCLMFDVRRCTQNTVFVCLFFIYFWCIGGFFLRFGCVRIYMRSFILLWFLLHFTITQVSDLRLQYLNFETDTQLDNQMTDCTVRLNNVKSMKIYSQ